MTRRILFALFLIIAARIPALAQADASGEIVGRLTDRSGAVLPGVRIAIRGSDNVAVSDDAIRVQTDVKTFTDALYNGDVDTVIRYSHPSIVAMLGGQDATRAAIEGVLLKLRGAGMRVESLTFPGPPEFLEGGGRRFAVVPTLSIITANGQRVESLNFQLGILEPGASEWRYVEGSRLTKQNVQVLFPGCPATYDFPPFYRKTLP